MLKKMVFKPGINRETTQFGGEGGWYDAQWIRFRQGFPEKIGGWNQISVYNFLGVCRSLWGWLTNSFVEVVGVGTNLKFYAEVGGGYYDITPIRTQATLTNPFTATAGSTKIIVNAPNNGCLNGDFVTFNGATGLGGNISAAVLNGVEFQVTLIDANNYSINVSTPASAADTGNGGTVNAVYQINVGTDISYPVTGWGAGTWGTGFWGIGTQSTQVLRLWSQYNFGEDLIFGPRGGAMYYYDVSAGYTPILAAVSIASPAVVTTAHTFDEYGIIIFSTTGALPTGITAGVIYYARNSTAGSMNLSLTPSGALINTSGTQSGNQYISIRATPLTAIAFASDVPVVQNQVLVSDLYRFVFAFGCNDYGTTIQNPLLIRWSDQESAANWTPSATNQAGSLPLSRGTQIICALQNFQSIMVFTDTSLYTMQYLGPPYVWNAQLVGSNISIISLSLIHI